jgi:hypothetical protein
MDLGSSAGSSSPTLRHFFTETGTPPPDADVHSAGGTDDIPDIVQGDIDEIPLNSSGGSSCLDALLAEKLAAADRELSIAQNAATRLNAARLGFTSSAQVATHGAALGNIDYQLATNGQEAAIPPAAEPEGETSQYFDAKLAMKMKEIEVLQRRTEENIWRLTSSRSSSGSALARTALAAVHAVDQDVSELSGIHAEPPCTPGGFPVCNAATSIAKHGVPVCDGESAFSNVRRELQVATEQLAQAPAMSDDSTPAELETAEPASSVPLPEETLTMSVKAPQKAPEIDDCEDGDTSSQAARSMVMVQPEVMHPDQSTDVVVPAVNVSTMLCPEDTTTAEASLDIVQMETESVCKAGDRARGEPPPERQTL